MLRAVLLDPLENRADHHRDVGRFFERIRIHFQKGEQMLVEPDRLVIVTIEQPFPMQPRLVDQTRQMDVTAQPFVGTARTAAFASSRPDLE